MKSWIPSLFPSALVLFFMLIRIAEPPFVEDLALSTFDFYQQLKPRSYDASFPVRIIDIDDETLARFGQWPWPRLLTAKLAEKLSKGGARVIAFDIVFAEADRTSPKDILPLWPDTPEIQALRKNIETLPDHDQVLAKTLESMNTVSGFALSMDSNPSVPAQKSNFSYVGKNPKDFLPQFKGAIINIPEIESVVKGNGVFSTIQERDGIIRRVPLVFRLRDSLYPALSLEAMRLSIQSDFYLLRHTGEKSSSNIFENQGFTRIQIGDLSASTDARARMWLYDSGFHQERFIPAWKVLTDEIKPGDLADKIAFIGTSAAGLKDLRVTPLNPAAAGVEVHAQLTEQILSQNFLIRPDWTSIAEILYFFSLALAIIFLTPLLSILGSALLMIGAVVGAFALSWHLFSDRGWLVDPLFPSLALLIIYLIVSLLHYVRTEMEKRQVRNAFSRYMSPALVKELAEHPERLALGGEIKNITLIFADIRGFTSIAEKLSAKELTTFMNRFFTPMTEIILKHNGTIDKYIGDCIMAFWNAPLDDPAHPLNACKAALQMKEHLVEWNKLLLRDAGMKTKVRESVRIGIGINTGDCCVGNLGSDQRFDYSALGDDVNLASRLESLSSIYGVDILIGPNTSEKIKNFAILEMDLMQVKGKSRPVRIFGLIGNQTLAEDPDFKKLAAAHEEMLKSYRDKKWEKAFQSINECLKFDTPRTRLQKFYQLYTDRIHQLKKNPPSPDWEGITIASTK